MPSVHADQGRRVLLFSQFVIVLDLVEELMDVLDLPFTRLDGKTPVEERFVGRRRQGGGGRAHGGRKC